MSTLILKLIDSGSDGAVLRGGTDKDGNPAFSLFDLGNLACNKERDSTYGKNSLYRLTKEGSEYKTEVDSFTVYLKFPGSGQRKTPCASIRGLQRYLMLLGGKVAAKFRETAEGIFTRVMAGDQSLIEVINANAVSQDPIHQAYRAALEQEPVAPVLDDFCLKRKRERDELLFDMELAERKLALEDGKLAHEEKRRLHGMSLIEDTSVAMRAICALKDMPGVDARTKLQVEDHIKNVLFNKLTTNNSNNNQPTITDGTSTNQTDGLNVSILAKELGFKPKEGQLISIGREMAKQYRETYKTDPTKHAQFTGGMVIPVNSYMERDRSMMERVIRAVMS